MNEKITVLTVSWYSANLLEVMISSLLSKAESPECLSVLVIDNTDGVDTELPKLKAKFSGIEILPFKPENSNALNAHAEALNFGFKKIETDYFLTIDPDVFVFKKKWDSFCLNLIENKQTSAIGTVYPFWWIGTYHNFPSPVFCFGRCGAFKKLGPDWLPLQLGLMRKIISFIQRQIVRGFFLCRRKILSKLSFLRRIVFSTSDYIPVCSFDTGSKMALDILHNQDFSFSFFEAVFPDQLNIMKNKIFENSDSLKCLAEYYEIYLFNNELILTHQYGSQNFFLRTDKGKDSNYWKKLISDVEELNNG